jgi:L-lactate utilization protein LutB
MPTTEKYSQLATDTSVEKTMNKLVENGIEVSLVNNKKEAREKVLELIPSGSEVMTMISVTLADIGVDIAINSSPDYRSIRNQLTNSHTEQAEKQRL